MGSTRPGHQGAGAFKVSPVGTPDRGSTVPSVRPRTRWGSTLSVGPRRGGGIAPELSKYGTHAWVSAQIKDPSSKTTYRENALDPARKGRAEVRAPALASRHRPP